MSVKSPDASLFAVILSVAKDLPPGSIEIFRYAQDDSELVYS